MKKFWFRCLFFTVLQVSILPSLPAQVIRLGGKINPHVDYERLSRIDQLGFHYNDTNDFRLGFEIVTEKGANLGPKNKGSFSWGGYYGTNYWADPKAKPVCLIMTQQTPNSHGDLSNKFSALVYST